LCFRHPVLHFQGVSNNPRRVGRSIHTRMGDTAWRCCPWFKSPILAPSIEWNRLLLLSLIPSMQAHFRIKGGGPTLKKCVPPPTPRQAFLSIQKAKMWEFCEAAAMSAARLSMFMSQFHTSETQARYTSIDPYCHQACYMSFKPCCPPVRYTLFKPYCPHAKSTSLTPP
jgi:hypothetical protein